MSACAETSTVPLKKEESMQIKKKKKTNKEGKKRLPPKHRGLEMGA